MGNGKLQTLENRYNFILWRIKIWRLAHKIPLTTFMKQSTLTEILKDFFPGCRIRTLNANVGRAIFVWLAGRGGGAVGRVVASDIRDPRFKSKSWKWTIKNVFICQLLSRKDENKEKVAWKGAFNYFCLICHSLLEFLAVFSLGSEF